MKKGSAECIASAARCKCESLVAVTYLSRALRNNAYGAFGGLDARLEEMKRVFFFLLGSVLATIGSRADPITLHFSGYINYVFTAPYSSVWTDQDLFDATAVFDSTATPFSQYAKGADYHLDSLTMTIHAAGGDWTATATTGNAKMSYYSPDLTGSGSEDVLQFTALAPVTAPLIDGTHFLQTFKLQFTGIDALSSFNLISGINLADWNTSKTYLVMYFDDSYTFIGTGQGYFTSVTSSADPAAVPEPAAYAWWAGIMLILFVPLRRWGVMVDGLVDAVSGAMRISPFSPVKVKADLGHARPDGE